MSAQPHYSSNPIGKKRMLQKKRTSRWFSIKEEIETNHMNICARLPSFKPLTGIAFPGYLVPLSVTKSVASIFGQGMSETRVGGSSSGHPKYHHS